MSKELIRLTNLTMTFEDGETILDNINLYINNKEFLTLLGPSGCGKTTMLRIIGGFLTPTSGDVLFNGKRINDLPAYQRKINTVFQRYALFPHLDVYDNIAFGLTLKKEPKDVIEQKVMRMLRLVSLEDYAHRNVTELSGGQQQRIAIARAMLKNAPILILDDSVSAVDTKTEKIILDNLKKSRAGKTTLLIAHRISTVEGLDKIIFLEDGRVEAVGPHDRLYASCPEYHKMVDLQKLEDEVGGGNA